jgi:DNA-directed RNA polymerase specialized sigma24 family protein|tara:strand:- start:21 stop:494 length:474 start_codon:yes stop_codon:yes gene_type:complete
MVQKTMILIAKKHQTWIDIVCTFGCTRTTAEDLVQEMYYKIQLKIEDGLNIMYQDEINYYYIFKTLKTLFIDLKRKGKNITIVTLDDVNLTSNDVNYIESYDKIQDALNKMYWYDRKVFEVINQGESIAEFSRKSFIHYYSLYNTYHKVKSKLKKLL